MLNFGNFIKEFLDDDALYFELDDLYEAKDDPTKEHGVSNNTKGVLHELLVGKHLTGGDHMEKHVSENGETPTQLHDRLKSNIHPKDYELINQKAKSAAAHIKAHIESSHPGHKLYSVSWTSKPGDTEKVTGYKASQKEDSSDIYVSTKHPKTGKVVHHGVSLKVSDNSRKNVPSSNLGMKSGGEKAKDYFEAHKREVLKAHPQLADKNSDARKEILKSNPSMKADVKEKTRTLLNKVAHSHAAELQRHLDTGNHNHVIHHIREVLHAHKTPAQQGGHNFFKHTTYVTAKGNQHHASEPGSEYEHILKDHKNISVKSSGTAVHFYHNGKKFASQAHKVNSQSDPLSTLKSAGKAV